MENKKLVKILTKDMAELEELIAEMKQKQHFDALEMEFVHTRAKGVLQLLQLLDASEQPVVLDTSEGDNVLEKLKQKVDKVSKLTAEIKPEKQQEEPEREEDEEQPLPGIVPQPGEQEAGEDEKSENNEKKDSFAEKDYDEGMLQEENNKPEAGSRLGDSFLKSKSVNDLITDQVKLEYKLSNRPVSSIQSSIGINDRFQYIRELFGGDNQKFMEAVKTLDSMHNIREAIEYLRANFKWKKNETSLKFVNLVKRRFQDSVSG